MRIFVTGATGFQAQCVSRGIRTSLIGRSGTRDVQRCRDIGSHRSVPGSPGRSCPRSISPKFHSVTRHGNDGRNAVSPAADFVRSVRTYVPSITLCGGDESMPNKAEKKALKTLKKVTEKAITSKRVEAAAEEAAAEGAGRSVIKKAVRSAAKKAAGSIVKKKSADK